MRFDEDDIFAFLVRFREILHRADRAVTQEPAGRGLSPAHLALMYENQIAALIAQYPHLNALAGPLRRCEDGHVGSA